MSYTDDIEAQRPIVPNTKMINTDNNRKLTKQILVITGVIGCLLVILMLICFRNESNSETNTNTNYNQRIPLMYRAAPQLASVSPIRLAPQQQRQSPLVSPPVPLETDYVIEFITDVEGHWKFFHDVVFYSQIITFNDDESALEFEQRTDGKTPYLVYGGDTCDRGKGDFGEIKIIKLLLDFKQRKPEQVIFLLGNRDINKLRLIREMTEVIDAATLEEEYKIYAPDGKAPAGYDQLHNKTPVDKLKWILHNTMGARVAFDARKEELTKLYGSSIQDKDVVRSYIISVTPDPYQRIFQIFNSPTITHGNFMLQYIQQAQMVFIKDKNVFMHSGYSKKMNNVREFAQSANTMLAAETGKYVKNPVLYNYKDFHVKLYRSGVQEYEYYNENIRTLIPEGSDHDIDKYNAYILSLSSGLFISGSGITRLFHGHTPISDTPTIVRVGENGYIVDADTGYACFKSTEDRGGAYANVRITNDIIYISGRPADKECHAPYGDEKFDIKLPNDKDIGTVKTVSGGKKALIKYKMTNGNYMTASASTEGPGYPVTYYIN